MDHKDLFKEVKNVLEGVKVPRNIDLILLKLKETLEIDNSDINRDSYDSYSVRYENLLIRLSVDSMHQKFKVSEHFDVLDEADNIIECY